MEGARFTLLPACPVPSEPPLLCVSSLSTASICPRFMAMAPLCWEPAQNTPSPLLCRDPPVFADSCLLLTLVFSAGSLMGDSDPVESTGQSSTLTVQVNGGHLFDWAGFYCHPTLARGGASESLQQTRFSRLPSKWAVAITQNMPAPLLCRDPPAFPDSFLPLTPMSSTGSSEQDCYCHHPDDHVLGSQGPGLCQAMVT